MQPHGIETPLPIPAEDKKIKRRLLRFASHRGSEPSLRNCMLQVSGGSRVVFGCVCGIPLPDMQTIGWAEVKTVKGGNPFQNCSHGFSWALH